MSNGENLQSFNVKRIRFKRNIAVIPGLGDIPEEVTQRCALWQVNDPAHPPPHLKDIANRVPLIICREPSKMTTVMTFIKDTFKTCIVVHEDKGGTAEKPQLTLEARVVAIENTIQ